MLADAGDNARWSRGPAVTVNAAASVLPASLPVTVCGPAVVAEHEAPRQVPSGESEKVVNAVTSPSELLDASKPSAVYAWALPAAVVAVAGLITMWSTTAAFTSSEAVPLLSLFEPVTVCAPATDAVHV